MEPLKNALDWLWNDPVGVPLAYAMIIIVAICVVYLAKRSLHNHIQDKVSIARAHGFAEGQDYGFEEGKKAGIAQACTERYIENSLVRLEAIANGEQ